MKSYQLKQGNSCDSVHDLINLVYHCILQERNKLKIIVVNIQVAWMFYGQGIG